MNPNDFPTFSIFLGDSKTMYFKALNAACCGFSPLDLTNCTEINIALPNQDGTFTNLLLSLSQVVISTPPVLGAFYALIGSMASALLNVGEFQNVPVTFTISGEVFTVLFQRALSVYEVT
jgi:hypothetical protein